MIPKNINKYKKGALLVPVIIVLFIISAIAFSLIQRSLTGFSVTDSSKHGYVSYQASDSGTESVLNEIKKLDTSKEKIPENTPASEVCDGRKIKCFKNITGTNEAGSSDMVSDIRSIKGVGVEKDFTRAIVAPLPSRMDNIIDGFRVLPCTNPVAKNDPECAGRGRCDVLVMWNPIASVPDNIDSYEIRKSVSSDLKDTSADWEKVNPDPIDPDKSSFLIPGVDKKYYFTVKIKNKDNFKLDSLYLAPKQINLDPSCL